MKPITPNDCPRRTLLWVAGATPQILTETLYALARRQPDTFIPTEIDVITTRTGKHKLVSNLLARDVGWFHRLHDDLNLPPIQFSEQRIHVITDHHGQALDDIRTPQENEAAANFITEWVRRLTQDDDRAIHASLAGGRKTMGYYLGYALSLFGRPQDRLSHVLVAPAYESSWDFFYPNPEVNNARPEDIDLAEIPFVRLRKQLPNALKGLEQGDWSFSATVAAAQEAINPRPIHISHLHRQIHIGQEQRISLTPASLAFYALFARASRDGTALYAPPKDEPSKPLYEAFMREADHADAREHLGAGIKADGMTRSYWDERKAKLRDELNRALGPLAAAYDIDATIPGRPAGFGLRLPAGFIHIEE